MAPVEISVTGSSNIYRPPERAILRAKAKSEGLYQDEVTSQAGAASSQVNDMLKELASKTASGEPTADAPVTVFSVGCMRSWSKRLCNDNPELRTRWHDARVSIEATFRDFAKLAEVATKLLAMPNVQVDDLNWELTNDTRKSLRSECRKSALQDAIHIAGEYAEVIGREVLGDVHVVQVKDSSHMVDYDACRFSASWGEEHHRLDPTPQDIPLRHHVDVTFRGE